MKKIFLDKVIQTVDKNVIDYKIVKYNNDMNLLTFKNFNTAELNVFFSICSVMKDKGVEIIEIDFSTLKKIAKIKPKSNKELISIIESTYDKLLNIRFKKGNDTDFVKFALFTKYEVQGSNSKVLIKVNEEFKYILNDITGNFTKFELEEFNSLKSKYSKECYKRLKQFKYTGLWRISIEGFRECLDVPEKYSISEMDRAVLGPIAKELGPIFKDLKIQKVKNGRKIERIDFLWTPEKQNSNNKKHITD